MPGEYAIAIALLALVVGMGLSWAYFREHIVQVEAQLEDSEEACEQLTEDLDQMTVRALDAEQSLELVLGEGDRDPLTAPVQVIRGGIR